MLCYEMGKTPEYEGIPYWLRCRATGFTSVSYLLKSESDQRPIDLLQRTKLRLRLMYRQYRDRLDNLCICILDTLLWIKRGDGAVARNQKTLPAMTLVTSISS